MVLAGRGILESVEPETMRVEDLATWEALVVANEREDAELCEAGIAFGFECGLRSINMENGSSSSDNTNYECFLEIKTYNIPRAGSSKVSCRNAPLVLSRS